MQPSIINFCEHMKHENGRLKYVRRYKETELELLAIWMLFLFREGRKVPTVIQGGGRVVLLGYFSSLDTRNLVQMQAINEKKDHFDIFWNNLKECAASLSAKIFFKLPISRLSQN